MIRSPPSVAERCLAAGLFAAVVLAAVGLAMFLLSWRAEILADSARTALLRDGYKASIAAASAAVPAKADVTEHAGDRLPGDSDAAAAGELQRLLAAMLQAERVEMASAQILPQKSSTVGPSIGIRLQVRGSLDRVQRLLHAVEGHRPLLFIERAVLRADPTLAPAVTSSGLDAVRLLADFEIVAVRAEGTTQAKRP